jgi:UDP-2,3-diacylglucosamine pyrophosphatase LpxH
MNVVGFPGQVRTLRISDMHLGTRGYRADDLLAFLHAIECRTLCLVGDIVDCWRLKRSWHWPASHQAVGREFLWRADAGTEVDFIPGHHDEAAREFDGLDMAGIKIRTEAIHVAADDRRFLVVHGDRFDGIGRYARWPDRLGDLSYQVMLRCNRVFNEVRRLRGLP